MLDAVVRLRPAELGAGLAGEKPADDSIARADSDAVRITLYLRAPQRDCKLKLWDPFGRNPLPLEPRPIRDGPDFAELEWRLEGYSIGDLNGRTVTWSARLASPRPDSFELRVEVFLGADRLPDGQFLYSGPLDASEIEERSGRFHFIG